MGRWPARYIIGLTGNIGTGKSVVRKMLEHLGAFGIDADGLAHAAIAKGAPAYEAVVKTFGEWILEADGQINRAALGNIVFANPQALAKLEALVHPAVLQAVDILISRASRPVVVIEAIKLIESGLANEVNSVWVVNASPEVQLARLTQKRKMNEAAARQRIAAQPPQSEKIARANVVIENNDNFDETWAQVQAAWSKIDASVRGAGDSQPTPRLGARPSTVAPVAPTAPAGRKPPSEVGKINVRRGKPGDAAQIAQFISRVSNGAKRLSRMDVMEAFGQKAYLLAEAEGAMLGLAGWQVENLITRVDDLYLAEGAPLARLLPPMVEDVEARSRELQSEAALIFVPEALSDEAVRLLAGSGYSVESADTIGVLAWREAVKESQPPGTKLLFKKLREDRVMRPV